MYYNDDENDDILDWAQKDLKDRKTEESDDRKNDEAKDKIREKLKEKLKEKKNEKGGNKKPSNDLNAKKESKNRNTPRNTAKSGRHAGGSTSGTGVTTSAGTTASASTTAGSTGAMTTTSGTAIASGAAAGETTAAVGGTAAATGGTVAAGGAAAGGTAATASGVAAASVGSGGIIPVIIGIGIVILIIIIIVIGIIGFFLTLPGIMSAKFHEIFDDVIIGIRSIFVSDVDATPIDQNVKDLAKYLEKMDYDLVGYGFVKPDRDDTTPMADQLLDQGYKRIVIDEDVNEAEEKTNNGEDVDIDEENRTYKVFYAKKYDEKTGAMEDVYSGEFYDSDGKLYDSTGLPKVDSNGEYKKYGIIYDSNNQIKEIENDDVLRTYILSERRFYIIRNNDDSWFQRVATYINHVLTGYKASWAQGMIELWVASDGKAESKYDLWDKVNPAHPSNVKITANGKMRVKVGWFNNPMYFDLDGWSGRYGLSTDMLISLHLATLSPDLVTTMAQTFDTKIQVYLDYVKKSKVNAYFHTPEMPEDSYPSYDDFEDYMQDSSWNPFDKWFLSKSEAKKIMKAYGIDSLTSGVYTCGGHDPSQVLYIYEDNYDIEYYGDSDYCFNEMAQSSKMNWEKDVMYNQHLKRYSGNWSVSGSSDSAPVNFFRVKETPSQKERDEMIADCKTKRGDKPVIIDCEEGGLWYTKWSKASGGTDENDIHISLLKHLLHGLSEMYNKVKDNPNDFNVILDENPDSCPLDLVTIFDPDSEYRFDKYISLSTFKTIPQENDGYYEVPIAVWKTNDEGKKEDDPGHNEDYDGELILSLLIRKTTVDKNYDFTALLYRNFSDNEKEEKGFTQQNTTEKTCSEKLADGELHSLCNSCRRYIRDIMYGLRKIDDDKFKTYKPYIARVVGSWFRDTYFIIPDSPDKAIKSGVYNYHTEYGYSSGDLERSNVNVIENDEVFQEATGELWTDYILDKDEYNYAIFVINGDGSYLESDADVSNWKNKNTGYPQEIYDSLKVLNKNGIDYYGYIDPNTVVSEETLNLIINMNSRNDNNSKSNKSKDMRTSDIERVFQAFEISYIKRPKTTTMQKTSGFSGWSAYNFDAEPSDEKIPLEVDESTPNAIRKVQIAYDVDYNQRKGVNPGNIFYYNIDTNRTVAQERDAQRGMTNDKIKYLFKNKKYYKYDGSAKTAFEIRDDWNGVMESFKRTNAANTSNLKKYIKENTRSALRRGILDLMDNSDIEKAAKNKSDDCIDAVINGYIDLVYYQELGNNMSDYTFARDLDGDGIVDIASERLKNNSSAKAEIESKEGITFDNNETTYTLDPRNPNLISKIDISTESLQAFSILENTHTADADYSYRDLKELFVELDYFDKEDLTEPAKDVLEWPLPQTDSYGWPDREFDKVNEFGTLIHSREMTDYKNQIYGQINGAKSSSTGNSSSSPTAKLYNEDQVMKLANANKNETKISNRANSRNNTNTPHMQSTFLDTAAECWKYLIDYYESTSLPEYGRDYTEVGTNWENSSKKLIDCSMFVAWVMYNYGYDDSTFTYTGYMVSTNYADKYGFTEISYPGEIPVTDIKPGDIIVKHSTTGGSQHTQIIKEVDYNTGATITYDCGNASHWLPQYRDGFRWDFYKDNSPGKIIRVDYPGTSNSSGISINGFEKLQPVVSPATAKILEFGKVTITNEGKEEILKPFYAGSEEDYEDSGIKDASNNRTFVNQNQYDAMEQTADAIEGDTNSSFGKEYETGYVKLEVIGKESLDKIKLLNSPELTKGFEAYYEDYHNTAQDKSICDSYTIYIEGIDLTGLMEETGNPDADIKFEDTILARKFEEVSGQSLSTSGSLTSNDNSGATTSPSSSSTTSSTSKFDISSYDLNYYTRKEIPTYYVPAIQDILKEFEDDKENYMPSVVKVDNDIYVEAGTLLGVTGNANMRIIMKDTKEGVVENVEDYLEISTKGSIAKQNQAKAAGSSASEYYIAWHINTYGKMAIPACGSWYTDYGDKINGVSVEYTNDDTGVVPNLMPELAMQDENLKHLRRIRI